MENVYKQIEELSDSLYEKVKNIRRDFHKYAEPGWLEIRTSSIIARRLNELGYKVLIGKDVCSASGRMGLVSDEIFEKEYERAVKQGADTSYASEMKNGFTGVIGILNNGEGPVTALRFDIDALYILEDSTENHRPFREGFSSVNRGYMHACGHDGHAAMGLGVAEVLMHIKDFLHGTVKLIFQPAEEGVRGAKSIVDKGHLDDVDFLLGSHITSKEGYNQDVIPGSYGALATTKFDVFFHGRAAHAGAEPQNGKNVMLGVAAAISNLYSIPRTGLGASRINVGTVKAGTGRNVIADFAKMEIEVRGETSEINDYMEEYALRIIKAAAEMHGLTYEAKKMGAAFSMHSDKEMTDIIKTSCINNLKSVKVTDVDEIKMDGSEDFSYMMKRVQDNGGKASFMRVLSELGDVLHGSGFDFEEQSLIAGIKVFSATVYNILK